MTLPALAEHPRTGVEPCAVVDPCEHPLAILNDTTPQADARYHALRMRLTPAQRLEAAMRLSTGVREMVVAGIRREHPAIGEDELRVRLTVPLYGLACARKLFGQVPEDAR